MEENPFNLKNRVVLLTGGAGMYGRGLATALAAAGATLVVASRHAANCETVAAAGRARGYCVESESYDQGEEDSIRALLERLWARFGRVDGLVNNSVARTMTPTGSFRRECEQSMKVNATGLISMHHHFGAAMARQGGGSIVNIGSIQGLVGPEPALYRGTLMPTPTPDYFFHKGGMLNLTRYYATLLGEKGVRVNHLAAGGFFSGQPEVFVKRYAGKTALGRMGDGNDLGGPVVFLLSEAARYITGANLPVDGGYTSK
ncbi:MAG TPA: SDR family oxidoreductase [Chthoniobacteraceae bacterium]|nr:SDR family oxidoreductase [Chthoniobacteraceae bacterium]